MKIRGLNKGLDFHRQTFFGNLEFLWHGLHERQASFKRNQLVGNNHWFGSTAEVSISAEKEEENKNKNKKNMSMTIFISKAKRGR